jgi:polyphosphate kinase 2 (PPK2 family)
MGDLHERAFWDQYQEAFEDTLTHTSTEWAPWWVIPSDNKWVSRALVSAILTESIQGLGLKPRKMSPAQLEVIDEGRRQLLAEP